MDISAEYIKMCGKAEEIQKLRHLVTDWRKGDWYRRPTNWIEVVADEATIPNLPNPPHGTVWLPRQDQLQEMISYPTLGSEKFKEMVRYYHEIVCIGQDTKVNLLRAVASFAAERSFVGCHQTMEQLWLAFVMCEKYNKIWDGEKWIAKP